MGDLPATVLDLACLVDAPSPSCLGEDTQWHADESSWPQKNSPWDGALHYQLQPLYGQSWPQHYQVDARCKLLQLEAHWHWQCGVLEQQRAGSDGWWHELEPQALRTQQLQPADQQQQRRHRKQRQPPQEPLPRRPDPTEQAAEELEEGSSTGEAPLDGDGGDEDLRRLLRMEVAQSSEEVMEVALQALSRLSPETALAALHLAARQLPADGPGCRDVTSSPALVKLLGHVRRLLPRLRRARVLARLAWTLGKLEVHNPDVDAALAHVCNLAPAVLHRCSPQDLTNALWGLARLCPGSRASGGSDASTLAARRLAHAIIGECSQQMESLTAQCLSNSLWAAARMHLRGPGVDAFVGRCLRELGARQLRVFTPQGLANALWALAELCTGGVSLTSASSGDGLEVCAAICTSSRKRLAEFQPQELSMLAWACAKVFRRAATRVCIRPVEVDLFLLDLAAEGRRRLPDLSAQSVSNIAWALATLKLLCPQLQNTSARDFLNEAMCTSAPQLGSYSPQAVANLLWAAVRLDPPKARGAASSTVKAFSAAVAREATLRMLEFSWRDLAGVSVALAYGQLCLPEALTFATLLVGHTAARCSELTPQTMLNIAQSAVRLGVTPESLQAMVDAIAFCIAKQQLHFNDVDQRQWKEVRGWCTPRLVMSPFVCAWAPS